MQFPLLSTDTIRVKITPGAKKDEYIDTLPDGTLKIKIKSIATDGKANNGLMAFLKKETGEQWKIKSGFTSERKILTKK